MYALGIDGGGTKTIAVVADETGKIFLSEKVGPSNPNSLSPEAFEEVMDRLLGRLKMKDIHIFEQLAVCFAGMSGVGESENHLLVEQALRKHLPKETELIIENDGVNALYSGTLGAPGIVQIAGTGAITLGVDHQKKMVRSGGWGYLFDDEGSGYDMGVQALRAIFQEYDGRGVKTSLTSALLNFFHVKETPDLIGKIYIGSGSKAIIASLSPIVVQEAAAGDLVACRIVQEACSKMFLSIQTCYQKLFSGEPIQVVLSGSVFTHIDLFVPHFQDLASKEQLPLSFIRNVIHPVGGAIVAAFHSKEINITEVFVERFTEEMGARSL